MDPIVSHFEIFARALLDQLDVIVKAYLPISFIYIRNVCKSVYTIIMNLS